MGHQLPLRPRGRPAKGHGPCARGKPGSTASVPDFAKLIDPGEPPAILVGGNVDSKPDGLEVRATPSLQDGEFRLSQMVRRQLSADTLRKLLRKPGKGAYIGGTADTQAPSTQAPSTPLSPPSKSESWSKTFRGKPAKGFRTGPVQAVNSLSS